MRGEDELLSGVRKKFLEDCRVIEVSSRGKYFEVKFESSEISGRICSGQFVNIGLRTTFFRRPFTLFDKGVGFFSVLVKVVGRGSRELSEVREGQKISILGPLGNSVLDMGIYPSDEVNLVAGGIGIANMFYLSKSLKSLGCRVKIFWGIKTSEEYFEECLEYADEVFVTSEDGKVGEKGFITRTFRNKYSGGSVYVSGPLGMIKEISMIGELPHDMVICSFESVMGCGVGVCYGCCIGSEEGGYYLVCKDGPNFVLSRVLHIFCRK